YSVAFVAFAGILFWVSALLDSWQKHVPAGIMGVALGMGISRVLFSTGIAWRITTRLWPTTDPVTFSWKRLWDFIGMTFSLGTPINSILFPTYWLKELFPNPWVRLPSIVFGDMPLRQVPQSFHVKHRDLDGMDVPTTMKALYTSSEKSFAVLTFAIGF